LDPTHVVKPTVLSIRGVGGCQSMPISTPTTRGLGAVRYTINRNVRAAFSVNSPVLPNVSPAANWDDLQTGESTDGLVVGLLGVGEGNPAVDFEALPAGRGRCRAG